MKKEIFDLEISDLSSSGQGVGHHEGLACFVNGALPGDLVKVQTLKSSKKYKTAKVIKLLKASPFRIEAACSVASKCGGCAFQYMDYQAQLEWKRKQLVEAMVRIGGFDRDSIESRTDKTLFAKENFRYRNKVAFPLQGPKENPLIGFYEFNSRKIVDTDVCLIQHPTADVIRGFFRQKIQDGAISLYDNPGGSKGFLKNLLVRVSSEGGVLIVCVMSSSEGTNELLPLVDEIEVLLVREGFSLDGLYVNVKTSDSNILTGEDYSLLAGRGYMEEDVLGMRYRISPGAFFQVNTFTTPLLFSKVLDYADLIGEEEALDLYCGAGAISLLLAKECKKVTGIELFDAAIDDARLNADLNDLDNVGFFAGAVEELLPKLFEGRENIDLVVLDPPRKGAERAALKALKTLKPKKIIYVSCNPATLARDCGILADFGDENSDKTSAHYKIEAITPVDMFPWTSHVECVVLMSRDM